MKPLVHAQNNVEKYGGVVEDYLKIHELLDSSKQGLGDKRHRAITHNTHFVYYMLPKIFGAVLKNSDGKDISVSQIGEDHILEDFGDHGLNFLPTISDWLSALPMETWMDNGKDYPPSRKTLETITVHRDAKLDVIKKIEQLEKVDETPAYLNDLKPIDWKNVQLDGATKHYREWQAKQALESINKQAESENSPLFFTSIASD